MRRHEIIEQVGKHYYVDNLENGEFRYPKALADEGKSIDDALVVSEDGTKHTTLDLRFVDGDVSILIETKNDYDKWNDKKVRRQMQAYVNYEKVLTGNKIIAIIANTEDDRVKLWWGSDLSIDDSHLIKNSHGIKSFEEYADFYRGKVNDREKVIRSTYSLNELLHKHGISETIRSQFVGTCLLALKNSVVYESLASKQIIAGMEEIITKLLNSDVKKDKKLKILKNNVLNSQDIRSLSKEALQEILRTVENEILPHINDRNTMGQDILNLFFTTFNKYVGKADKNQAFTPDHIVHLMCNVIGINRHSKVLDPCCGSGAFLVRAMTEALDDCSNDKQKDTVKKNNIFGIEYDEKTFGLSTTNMLIHGDGNSSIRLGSCFELEEFIQDANINVVLMNPPFNGQRKHCRASYVKKWKKAAKQDPSRGFHYVEYIASIVKTGKLAVLLPTQCALSSDKEIKKFKQKMLSENTLDAVFSLPPDIFHPGAAASACCMIFTLGVRHENAVHDTFFGYFRDDGFIKRKNLGRVEQTKSGTIEGVWSDIEAEWLDAYHKRKAVAGLSVTKKVTADDEWLAEAYMETDYNQLRDSDFEKVIRDYIAFKVTLDEI